MKQKFNWLVYLLWMVSTTAANASKHSSVFYSPSVRTKIQANVAKDPWAQSVRDQAIQSAAPWLAMADDGLWSSMFAPTITRSWMVWSNGHCPSCKKSVTMYNWKIAALDKPWKVQCPHCQEFFPKNDFAAYYRSGMDEHGLFAPHLADRSLLFNNEHPDEHDPLHRYGVDDGEGYVEGTQRWRFIGAYLIYGQWKQLILTGVRNLAAAYVLTGDPAYSHKAAILLDRISDVYPQFDFVTQGLSYERQDSIIGQGYVTVWHDACEETRELALAYDMIYDALEKDAEMVKFLSQKAKQFKLINAKSDVAAIRRNIETNLLQDPLRSRHKIESNFPRTDATIAIIETILGWPEEQQKVLSIIDQFVEKATAVDGLAGEKGLAGYSAGDSRALAHFLSLYNRLDVQFLKSLWLRHPNLAKTFRFHVDTWFNQQYYPNVGDCGIFGQKMATYLGATFSKNTVSTEIWTYSYTNTFSLFLQLYELTGDPAYVQLLYKANDHSLQGLPYDLLVEDAKNFQDKVAAVIQRMGSELSVNSFNKQDWCLAMLYSGSGEDRRCVWIDYDIGGNHCHADAMNLGLFAKGLDLLPGFGYPPVQFGGWTSAKAIWYRKTAAHNTVVVNGQDQMPGIGRGETEPLAVQLNPLKKNERGKTTCWMPGVQVQAIRVSGAKLYHGADLQQYERTVGLIDISATESYVLDLFRVIGGTDHARFFHGYFGELETSGLALKPAPDYGFETQMSQFRSDAMPAADWRASWRVEDRYRYLLEGTEVHLNLIDLTRQAEASLARTWIAFGFNSDQTAEIPSLLLRRKSEREPLSSCFVSLLEPGTKESLIKSAHRLNITDQTKAHYSDMNVALAVQMDNGDTDLILCMDVENPQNQIPSFAKAKLARVGEWKLSTDAEFCLLRKNNQGKIKKIALAHGTFLRLADIELKVKAGAEFIELDLGDDAVKVVAGNPEALRSCRAKLKPLKIIPSLPN